MDEASAAERLERVLRGHPLVDDRWSWVVRPGRNDDLEIVLRHPASAGMVVISSAQMDEAAEHEMIDGIVDRNPEFGVASAAPELEHVETVLGLRALVDAFQWTAPEVRALSGLLLDAEAINSAEADWLDNWIAGAP